MKSALILFAHGSRDPQWAAPFRVLQEKIAAARPGLAVELAFLELMRPTLPEAVMRLASSGHERIVIAPLFMAQGAHLKRDLGELLLEVRERHAEVGFELLPAAGEVDAVLDAMSAWLVQAAEGATQSGEKR